MASSIPLQARWIYPEVEKEWRLYWFSFGARLACLILLFIVAVATR
jgi:hypothetical protein